MASRRTFLKSGLLAFPLVFASPRLRSPFPEDPSRISFGLWFDHDAVDGMREAYRLPLFASLREKALGLDRNTERRFLENGVRYNDQLFDILRLSNNAQLMAMHFLMEDDADAADLAVSSVRAILKFEKWDYFLEAGTRVVGIQRASSTLIGVVAAADWLGDYVSKTERRSWMRIAGERGCASCYLSLYGMRYPDRVIGWTRDEASTYFEHRPDDRVDLSRRHIILDRTNLKAVPAAALSIGSTAYEKTFGISRRTASWREQAAFSLASFKDFYKPDGSYDEGVSYAHYTSLHLIHGATVLKRSGGPDLTDDINWPGYTDYLFGMSMPTASDSSDIVNFGDNGNPKSGEAGQPARTAVAWWTARKFRDGRARWFAENLGGSQDEWSLSFFDPSVRREPPAAGPLVWHSDLDWITARSGYTADDWVLGMRSGGPSNHEHADRNSIVFKAFGEHLVADPYRPPYQFKDPRWMMRSTAGHSAVLVDGLSHQYHDGSEGVNASLASAQIVRKTIRKEWYLWSSDATPAYEMVNDDIHSITRTCIVIPDGPVVILFDKVIKKAIPSRIQARFFGFNHDDSGVVRADTTTFSLERPTAWLWGASVAGKGTVQVQSLHLPIPEDESRKHPFAEVATRMPSLDAALLTVLVPTRINRRPPISVEKRSDTEFAVTVRLGDRTITGHVFDTDTLPEFERNG